MSQEDKFSDRNIDETTNVIPVTADAHDGDIMFNEEIRRKSSFVRPNLHASSLTILNYTIGITIMFLPKYLIYSGVGLGSFLLFFFAIMNYVSCYVLVYCARALNIISYYDVGRHIFSPNYIRIFTLFYLSMLYGNILIYQQFAI